MKRRLDDVEFIIPDSIPFELMAIFGTFGTLLMIYNLWTERGPENLESINSKILSILSPICFLQGILISWGKINSGIYFASTENSLFEKAIGVLEALYWFVLFFVTRDLIKSIKKEVEIQATRTFILIILILFYGISIVYLLRYNSYPPEVHVATIIAFLMCFSATFLLVYISYSHNNRDLFLESRKLRWMHYAGLLGTGLVGGALPSLATLSAELRPHLSKILTQKPESLSWALALLFIGAFVNPLVARYLVQNARQKHQLANGMES